MQQIVHLSASDLRDLTKTMLVGLGLRGEALDSTTEALHWADLSGIDTHGIGMLPYYDTLVTAGRIDPTAVPAEPRINGATATIDAMGNLGHAAGIGAIDLGCTLAAEFGLSAIGVRNAAHYGAAGFYADRAARRGIIGISTSAVADPYMIPARGIEKVFGTNPLAFAAPSAEDEPVLLDIATSTAALGKVHLAQRRGSRVPEGWAVDPQGRPLTDPEAILADARVTPLGATPEHGVHKGYGLATMVEILSSLLPGASWTLQRPDNAPRDDVGQFYLLIDPARFRSGFPESVAAMSERLRASPPADPALPVLVPGDPESTARRSRADSGVTLPPGLVTALRDIGGRRSIQLPF
ncbi:Ldh family oxidoreductase [Tropicimonas isoalkanivorans]|uniref:Malate/lactate/ureidoglycolate dehydrogenase, LDH2 family n=1 Tax=Tropicimonas isoalkanivorans TaxID=441112 RepID=A0A1I1I7H5_9RHOB|nr:Ldh family oxidoreductase [Tropicimonas isoalkanivorans]SFC29713.1 Malate/lactate/ureidoglycolate dehydrogenase, LDH2 family [Tropicimonas isoalkanivorans]